MNVRESMIALIFFATISVLYVFRLFYPVQNIIVTPDIGTSDAVNLSLSQKYILAQSYTRGKLPLWETGVNAGFPMLAEGQIGAFFLPNIILYRIFPFVTAYNASLVFAITLTAWGTYLWSRQWGVRPLTALLAGMTMAFSGAIVPHLTHVTLLQGFSMMPLLAWLALLLIRTPSFLLLTVFALLASQQICTGFFQAAFITWVLVITLAAAVPGWSNRLRALCIVALGIIAAIGLSAVQILPSREFLSQTTARYGFDQTTASSYSFRPDNFLTIFNPFAIGNPRNATYNFSDQSIFWENNLYLGILPLFGIGLWRMNKQKRETLLPLFCLLALSAILMTGKYSPAYLVYSFWPMNLFRVPSRYAILFVFALVTLCSLALDTYKIKKTLVILIILLQGSILWYAFRTYHAYDPPDQWLAAPEIISYLTSDEFVLSVDDVEQYDDIFRKYGFADIRPYRFLRNNLQPYINILWDIRQLDTYPSRILRRPGITNAFLREHFEDEDKTHWEKLLTLFSVRYVLSHKPIGHTTLALRTVIGDPWMRLSVYENTNVLPRAYLAGSETVAKSYREADEAFMQDSFVPGVSALVEEPVPLSSARPTGKVRILQETGGTMTMSASNVSDGAILVVQQTWYPGWQAYVDGVKERVLPVNVRFSGIRIPGGNHEIVLRYEPTSISRGMRISIATAILLVLAGIIEKAYRSAIDVSGRHPRTA